ncbi:MAG: ABC transporter substrate-binding protein [Sporichthyaceae bacterium]
MSPSVRRPALLLALALTTAGCTGAGEDSTAEAPLADPDRLTIALAEDVGPLNIFASHEEPITELVYDKLLAPSPYVEQPAPWLATAVRTIDPATVEADLRTDVRWHDGERFDAADVVFTVDYFKRAPTGRWTHHVADIPTVETVEAVDSDTVRFRCAFPCPDLATVTLADLPIIPEHVWSKVEPVRTKTVSALPIGTGPYRLAAYSATSGYRFEANPEYFAGKPRVRELLMPVIGDPNAAFTALRARQIDATTHHLPPELIDSLVADAGDGIDVVKTAPLQFPELLLNYDRAPFDEPRFRRAIGRALDRDQLLNTVFLGKGRPATSGYVHPDAPFANPAIRTPYDPDEARRLLDELGYRDGDGDGVREGPNGRLSWPLIVEGARGVNVRAAELIAEDLREVGLDVRIESRDVGSNDALRSSREFDLMISRITAHGVADPTQFIMSHRSGYLWKAPNVPYPAWDALFEAWKAADTVDARTRILYDMQVLFNDAPTSIPLYYPDEYWAVRENYDGWVESPGYGLVHKFSLLPAEVGRSARAVTTRS